MPHFVHYIAAVWLSAAPFSFDQARLIRHKERLVANGIDPSTGLFFFGICRYRTFPSFIVSSGMPLDSKAVTRL